MTILPGSLDYLYHNGIIDHIPLEAYQTVPMTASGQAQLSGMGMGHGFSNSPLNYNIGPTQLNGSQYLRQAQGGYLYDTYTGPDVFVRRNNSSIQDGEGYSLRKAFSNSEGYGRDMDPAIMAYGEEGKGFYRSFSNGVGRIKNSVLNSPDWLKGLLAGGIMIATLVSLFKGKKCPNPQATKVSFIDKLKSLFKK